MGKIVKFNLNNQENTKKLDTERNVKIKNDKKEEGEITQEGKKELNETKEKTLQVEKESKSKLIDIKKEKSILDRIVEGIEEHVLYNFAVKQVLGVNFRYEINNKNEIGVIGKLAYEHKRRAGVFVADFIAKGYKDKKSEKVIITELAFLQGEPDFYNTIKNTLKAKKILPNLV